jgi:hypothetical protein
MTLIKDLESVAALEMLLDFQLTKFYFYKDRLLSV